MKQLKMIGIGIITLILIFLLLHPIGFGLVLLYDNELGFIYKIRNYWVGAFKPTNINELPKTLK